MILFAGENSCVLPENYPDFSLLPEWEKPKKNQNLIKKNYTDNFFLKEKIRGKEENHSEGIFRKDQDEIENEILEETEAKVISVENFERTSFLNFYTLRFGQKNFIESVLQNKLTLRYKISCSEKIIEKNFSKNFSENILAFGGEDGLISLMHIEKNFFENSTKRINELNNIPSRKTKSTEFRKENGENFSKDGSVSCLSWNKILSNLLISGSETGIIRCWDIKEGKILFEKKNYKSRISCLEWSRLFKTEFLFLSSNSEITFSDIRCGKITQNYISQKPLHSVHWTKKDHLMMIAEKKGKIGIYDRRNFNSNLENSRIFSFRGIKDEIKTFLVSPKKKNFLLVGKKGKIETWNHLDQMQFRRTSPNPIIKNKRDRFGWVERDKDEKVINLKWKKGFFLLN